MKLFSLDCSTTHASACLVEDNREAGTVSWTEDRARHEGMYPYLAELIASAGWTWDMVDVFAVGRGPGAYSGLRVSLLAIQALAAPGAQPVVAVSSMEALALALMEQCSRDEITMIGDARRGSIWFGPCRADALPREAAIWQVAPRAEAEALLAGSACLATPHGELESMRTGRLAGVDWINGAQHPHARHVARLAKLRLDAGAATCPLTPLYLHPAV